jgi:hypothetical protein
MPYPTQAPTPELLLSLMRPGAIYPPHILAKRLRTHAAPVKAVLLEMVRQGTLAIIKPRKNVSFILAGTEHLRKLPEPKPKVDPATVAQPRTYAVMTGELTGYFAEMYRRADLAMTLRRVA